MVLITTGNTQAFVLVRDISQASVLRFVRGEGGGLGGWGMFFFFFFAEFFFSVIYCLLLL